MPTVHPRSWVNLYNFNFTVFYNFYFYDQMNMHVKIEWISQTNLKKRKQADPLFISLMEKKKEHAKVLKVDTLVTTIAATASTHHYNSSV